jgi:hypothetical protein
MFTVEHWPNHPVSETASYGATGGHIGKGADATQHRIHCMERKRNICGGLI